MGEPTPDEIEAIRQLFEALDKQNTGKISYQQMQKVVQASQIADSFTLLIMNSFDQGSKGYLVFDDFVRYVNAVNKVEEYPDLLMKPIFNGCSKNQEYLTPIQFRLFANLLCISMPSDRASSLIEKFGKEQPGKLSYKEACEACESCH